MSTTPAPSHSFWTGLKSLLPALELAGNVAVSVLVPGGPALASLLSQLEDAVNPAIQQIGSPQSTQSAVMTIYATIIGVLTVLKATPGLPQATLAQIDGFIEAAKAGTAGYFQAATGFDPANYQPVTPIV